MHRDFPMERRQSAPAEKIRRTASRWLIFTTLGVGSLAIDPPSSVLNASTAQAQESAPIPAAAPGQVPAFDPVEESFLPTAASPQNGDDASVVVSDPAAATASPPLGIITVAAQTANQPPEPYTPELSQLPAPENPVKADAATETSNPNFPVPWAGNDRPVVSMRATIALPAGELPRNRAREIASTQPTELMVTGTSRPWLWQQVEWEAAATRHLPLYFEEPMLERLGYTHGWGRADCDYCATDCDRKKAEAFQPFVSAAAFFGRVPILPYQMGVDLPWEPIYTLGEPLPGSPAPYEKQRLPLSLRGAVFQAGAVTGAAFIIP